MHTGLESCGAEQVALVEQAAAAAGVSVSVLGKVTSGAVQVGAENLGSIQDWKNKYDTAIENLVQ
jgi:phosphoribosylformylglycinamidine synthase